MSALQEQKPLRSQRYEPGSEAPSGQVSVRIVVLDSVAGDLQSHAAQEGIETLQEPQVRLEMTGSWRIAARCPPLDPPFATISAREQNWTSISGRSLTSFPPEKGNGARMITDGTKAPPSS